MRLYLVRHGIAIDRLEADCPPEPDRFLTEEGIEKTRAAAQGLATLLDKAPAIFTSPYRRAVETAEILTEVLGGAREAVRTTEALLPERDPAEAMGLLDDVEGDALFCGHAPNLDLIFTHALTGRMGEWVHLKKASAACLELSPKRNRVRLLWLLPPSVLRRLGGAQRAEKPATTSA